MTQAAPDATSRVVMDLQPGERVSFAGTGIELEFFAKSGRIARLCFITPKVVRIERRGTEQTKEDGSPCRA